EAARDPGGAGVRGEQRDVAAGDQRHPHAAGAAGVGLTESLGALPVTVGGGGGGDAEDQREDGEGDQGGGRPRSRAPWATRRMRHAPLNEPTWPGSRSDGLHALVERQERCI